MDDKLIFVDVFLQERIWGGDYLSDKYRKKDTTKVGEAWIFSGHLNGQSKILNGSNKGMNLNDYYLEKRHLFNKENHDRFPLLIKTLDAKNDLSVQVHPSDRYALKHHNDLGKNECWYILDANKDAEIIFGLNTKDKKSFVRAVTNNNLQQTLNKVNVKKSEFYNIPAGTVHAIGEGIKILEIQQSSDTTYRIYDYDRIDDKGNKRELHLKKALDVINYKIKTPKQNFKYYGPIIRYVSNKYFTVDKMIENNKVLVNQNNTFTILFANKKDAVIKIDGIENILEEGYCALVTNKVKSFYVESKGEVFLIKEDKIKLKKMYQF